MKFRNLVAFISLAMLLAAFPVDAVQNLSLHALFKDKAIVIVDGARRVLKVGDTSPEGVKLISTDTQEEKAEVEVAGKRQELRLGMVISSFVSSGKGSVVLYPDRRGHFFSDGLINGVAVHFLVDTGATGIAMNSATARRVGIDYQRVGRAGYANTASGVARTYYVKLDSVQVGDIKMHNVDAGIMEGTHPVDVLLGMSFLGSLDMKRDSEKLELRER
ncbi:MAG TPA: TIGR02281 family clan AA aspartic protease [Burkholderiaceae bacterium]|nr:TIGR02281 family clan AA aspartic protease [Burkholderiaceae bacterium]